MHAQSVCKPGNALHDAAMTHPVPATPSADPWTAPADELAARLRMRKAGARALRLHDRFPDFSLPDSQGRHVSLSELTRTGPIVLGFFRGRWCPFCQQDLMAWHDAMPRLEASGGRFVGVSAETGGLAEDFRRDIAPAARMLCDIDHGLAMMLGLAFVVGEDLHRRYVEAGIDLAHVYGNSGRILPMTATYVIDGDGVVRYARINQDFRVRPNPSDVIAIVQGLRGAA